MNHIYRIVWSELAHAWVAVAENVRSHGKRPGSALICLAIAATPAWSLDATTLPGGGQVVAGMVSIGQNGNTLNISQGSQRAAIDWQSFNVGSAASVNFQQPSASAVALNRVLGNEASQIYGRLNANGQVFFSNPNGVLFARGAQVNVGGILATTLNIANSDFMTGNYRFTTPGHGTIRNEGLITATGSAVLLGNTVENAGQIVATTATLMAGNQIAIDLTGDGLIHARIEEPSLQALIENSGSIDAVTAVTLTAGQARSALDRIVNNSGVVRATGLVERGGNILLEAASIENSGTLDASSATGRGGAIDLKATERIALTETSKLGADGTAGGTVLAIVSAGGRIAGALTADGMVSAQGNGAPASGGFIETSASRVQIADGFRVATTGGEWLIDPVDFTITSGSGAQTTSSIGASTLSGNLAGASVTIATDGSTAGNGDIFVNAPVTWSSNNTLTLSAHRNINVNADITATGASAGLSLYYGSSGVGILPAIGTSYSLGNGTKITLSGATPTLMIGNESYTVINSLGVETSTTKLDLQGIRGTLGDGLASNYALGSDIPASTTSGWNATAGFEPLAPVGYSFTGKFDGLGHTISNLTINRSGTDYVGLFGVVASTGVVRNVGVTSPNITGQTYTGGLVGSNVGTISDSYVSGGSVTGSASSSYAGGLVGSNQGTIRRSYSTVPVTTAGSHAGGLAGENAATIEYSYATGSVTSTVGSTSKFGGLVGYNRAGGISNSYATGGVAGNVSGGLVGLNDRTGTIANSYAAGRVSAGTIMGGLVGTQSGGAVTQSYWDTDTSGQPTSAAGEGRTTVQMKQVLTTPPVTYDRWSISSDQDSSKTWRIYERQTYPLLRSFLAPLTATANNASKTYDGNAYSGGNGVTYSYSPNSANLFNGTVFTGTSQGAVNVGNYVITPAVYSNQNGYDIAYSNGALTINRAPLTVIANNATKTYDGQAFSGGNGVTYSGLVNGESSTVLGGTLGYSGTSQGAVNAGNYVITPGGLNSTNYLLSFVDGALTISPATLTVINGNLTGTVSKTYDGTATATLAPTNYSLSGWVGSDNANVTKTAGTYDTANAGANKTVTVNLSPTDYAAQGATNLSNYSLPTVISGNVGTIDKANATVTANSATTIYNGLAQSVTGFTASGLVNGQTIAVLGGVSTSGGSGTNAGSYMHTASGTDGNYALSFVDGTLTITQRPITTSFGNITKTYDGNTSAVMPTPTFNNVIDADLTYLSLTGAGNFDSRHVGSGKTVTYSGVSLGGSAASNYTLSAASYTGKGAITQLASVEWVGGPSGDWMTASNWAGGALPDNNNVALAIFPYSVSVTSGGPFDLGDTRITANGGNFQLKTFGGLTSGSGSIQVPAGQMTLITHSPMVVGTGGLQAGTGITLQSLTADPNSTITLNGPLTSTSGSVAISAYSHIYQNANITAPSVSMTSSQGNIIVASNAVTTAGSIYYAAPMGFIDASPGNFRGSFPFFQANSLPASLQALMAAPAALQQTASIVNQLQEEEPLEEESSWQSGFLPRVLAESEDNPARLGPSGREGAASGQEIFRLLIANSLIQRPLDEVILLPLNPSRGLVCR
jgi:filamentous hemagglutinin family protein